MKMQDELKAAALVMRKTQEMVGAFTGRIGRDEEPEERKKAASEFLDFVKEIGFDPTNPIIENSVAVILNDYGAPAVQLSSAKARIFEFQRHAVEVERVKGLQSADFESIVEHRRILNECEIRRTAALEAIVSQNERATAASERQATAFEAIAKALEK
jgi:hypothetical protein